MLAHASATHRTMNRFCSFLFVDNSNKATKKNENNLISIFSNSQEPSVLMFVHYEL